MKRMKQHISLLIVLAMILVPFFPAMAADGEGSISAAGGEKGYTYTVYQIFTGDPTDNNTAFENLKWSDTINANAFVEELKTDERIKSFFPSELPTDAANVAAAISRACMGNNDANAAAIAEIACKYMTSGAGTVLSVDGKQSDTFPFGFYAIAIANGTSGGTTYGVVSVLTDASYDLSAKTLGPKENEPTLEKKVKTFGENGVWQDAADYSVGDEVEFRLTAMLPSNFEESNFNTYRMIFHDKQGAGLTLQPDTINVTAEGTLLDNTQYRIVPNTEIGDGCTFEVEITDVTKIAGIGNGDAITLTYKATLNDTANIGADGNLNTAQLTYYENGSTTPKETPEDIVTVFTFQIEVDKVDSNGAALAGAEFTLTDENGNQVDTYKVNTEGTQFTFTGLKEGTYTLKETKAPEGGYNPIDPIFIKVTADYEEICPGKSTLRSLTAVQVDEAGNVINDATATAKFTTTLANGNMQTNIVNRTGVVLPTTGGIGTTIFYAVGGLLIVGAVVLLVTKRRMNADEK